MNRMIRIFLCWAMLMLLTVGTVFAGHLEDIAARGTIRFFIYILCWADTTTTE